MISVLSRANHSLSYGFPNNDAERDLCIAILKDTFLEHVSLFELLDRNTLADNDQFVQSVFKATLKSDGYFASMFRNEN